MVKKWIVMISLTLILIVGCCFESKYINNSFGRLINTLETFQIELTENKEKIDTEENIAKAYSIHNDWHAKLGGLKCLIWHTGLKDIEVSLAKISTYVSENDYTESYAEIASLIDYVAHYLDDFKISAENIL